MKRILNIVVIVVFCFFVFSCKKDEGQKPIAVQEITSLTISSSGASMIADGESQITITASNQFNTDVTSKCTFYANDQKLNSNKFTTTNASEYAIKAIYNTVQSEPLKVKAFVKQTLPAPKNILIQDFTGTWCGWCPRVSYSLEEAVKNQNRIIPVAIHSGSKSASSGSYDPFINVFGEEVRSKFQVNSFPTALIDQKNKWDEYVSTLSSKLTNNSDVKVDISSRVDGAKANVDVKLTFINPLSPSFRLVAYIIEDKLVYKQVNYLNDGKPNPIPDFIHNYVLRDGITDAYGISISIADIPITGIYEKAFQYNVPPAWDINNLSVVAFVTKEDGSVLNVERKKLK